MTIDLIVFRISLPDIVIDSREEAVRYDLSGSTELLTAGEHCKLKKIIKRVSLFFKIRNVFIAF